MENVISGEAIELVNTYYSEAYNYFQEIEAAKENIKDVIEAASAGSKLPKKVIRAYFNNKFKAKLKELQEQADILEILSGSSEDEEE